MDVSLNPAANRLLIEGKCFRGHRRWEATVLAALIQGRHACPVTACGPAQLDDLLARHGQTNPLTRKQWGMIWQSVRSMFEAAGASDALALRLCHPPRGATVGPWWWRPTDGDHVVIEGTPLTDAEMPLPGLASDSTAGRTAVLCRQALICQSQISEGQLIAASDALAESVAWTGATPELDALRHLRLAEVQTLRRDFHAAERALSEASRLIASSKVAAAYLDPHLSLIRHRMAYMLDPVTAYESILPTLSATIHRPARIGHPGVDLQVRGLTLNLTALCERRWVERHAGQERAHTVQLHAQRALDYWAAALFGFLVSNQHVHAHNMCSNVAYFLQRLCELKVTASPDDALSWYGLAQAWHNRFDLPDDTIWEYIFIGDFWLERPDVRQRLAERDNRAAWAGRHPANIDFYAYSLQRALEIGDPRQLAHAALNLWRFGRLEVDTAATASGRDHLRVVLSAHPDLREIMHGEGYALPKFT